MRGWGRVLVTLLGGFVAAAAPAAASETPEIRITPDLPTGWLTGGSYDVTAEATAGATALRWLTVHVDDKRKKPRFTCDLLRGCPSPLQMTFTIHPESLADGDHELIAVAGAVNVVPNTVKRVPFRVDHTPPAPPAMLEVAGGEGWRSHNRFDIRWRLPASDAGAPLAAVRYELCPASATSGCLYGRAAEASPMSIAGIAVPTSGRWRLRVALEDAAGNVDIDAGAVTELLLDASPPTLAIEPRDPADPALIVLQAHDADSGLADVTVEVRRRGDDAWRTLPVERRERTVAVLDDDALAPGVYDIRGRAVDVVGNERTVGTWRTGEAAAVELPVRRGSAIVVGAPGAKGRLNARPLLEFGKVTMLRGMLTDERGSGRPGASIVVTVGTGAAQKPLTTLTTDRIGRFAYRAPRGPARTLRFSYAGSPTTRAASAEVALRVRARTTLTASKRKLHNGDSVILRGRLSGREVPAAGKLLTLQARVPGGWRTFGTARARAKDGRWSYRYRFTNTSRTTRYSFRAAVPTEASYPYLRGTSKRLTVVVHGTA